MIEVNGLAHVILTVSQWEKAHAFYAGLLPFLGMRKVYDGNNFLYHVGGRTAIGIQRCAEELRGEAFNQNRVGLHHLCLRARTREDVDKVAEQVRALGGRIDRGPLEGDWAPGYYYFVFEDPDGISGWRSTTSPARDCSRPIRRSAPVAIRTGTRTSSRRSFDLHALSPLAGRGRKTIRPPWIVR